MAAQHVQQLIAEHYDYDRSHWGTAESSYIRQYLEHLEGRRTEPPKPPGANILAPKRVARLEERILREWRR